MPRKKGMKVRTLRGGVLIKPTTTGEQIVFSRYTVDGKEYKEWVGPLCGLDDFDKPYKAGRIERDKVVNEARRLTKDRKREAKEARQAGERWLTPKERQDLEAQEQRQAENARRELLFEVAAERFLKALARRYARPDEVRRMFRGPLTLMFAGSYLDEIKRKHVRAYYEDRMNGSGPFQGGRKVGRRSPDREINALSKLYSFLRDSEETELSNPCHSPDTLEPYEPARVPVIAEGSEQREALFKAAPNPKWRALWMLTYYTAARVESEPCKLLHGDVEFAADRKITDLHGVQPMGIVRFRKTKTRNKGRGYREVPLHPEAEKALKKIMLERPTEPQALERWKLTPIFTKRRKSSTPMDRHSYKKAWEKTLAAVTEPSVREDGATQSALHPELAGMILRDFRPTAKTVLIDAGVPEITVDKILGHKGGVREGYYRPDLGMKLAILTLDGRKSYPESYTEVMSARAARKRRIAKVV